MNRWLKLALTTVISAAVVVTGVFGAGVPLPSAVANTASSAIVVAAKNSSITVGADAAGALHWSTDSGVTWTASGTKVGDHPVTSIIWNGSVFIASSYFSAARSSDGQTWSRFLLPVGSAFDPGNLISDAEFFTSGTMSVDQIQAFLNDKVPECRSGYVCMKDYRETTFTRDATVLCNAYEAGENESAAQIIFKVSAACGVSAEALLVLIQKEMGLVTHTWPSTWRFQKATGYACPDTAPCDERFFGFYNQVYNAARQFKRYSNPPGTSRFFTWFPVGQTSQVRLHPNAACGTTPVVMKNQATAGLHYYTPYTPNQSAVVNMTGVGDGCSAYGNRNFWRIYNFWFKKPGNFRTFVTASRGVTMAIDREGGVSVSSNAQTWTRPSVIPTVSTSNPVLEFGRTPDGDFAVLTQAGTAFQSEDGGLTWKTLPVERTERQENTVVRHTVQAGDTVWQIATANSVTIAAVVAENNLPNDGNSITVGQELTITRNGVVSTVRSPVIPDPSIVLMGAAADQSASSTPGETTTPPSSESESTPAPEPAPAPDEPVDMSQFPALEPLVVRNQQSTSQHVVRRGETLFGIARANRTTISNLVSLNSLTNPNRIFVGQRLTVTSGATSQQSFHRVQAGDTLPVIALRRSIALGVLTDLNPGVSPTGDLRDGSLIRVG
jgi:LysM repeat protein